MADSAETTIHQLKCLLKLVAYSAFESFDLLFHSLWSPHSMCLSKNSTSSNFCNVSYFEQSWQLLQIKVAIIIPFLDHSKRTCAQFHRFLDPPPIVFFCTFSRYPFPMSVRTFTSSHPQYLPLLFISVILQFAEFDTYPRTLEIIKCLFKKSIRMRSFVYNL